MKKVEAIIREEKLERVKEFLEGIRIFWHDNDGSERPRQAKRYSFEVGS